MAVASAGAGGPGLEVLAAPPDEVGQVAAIGPTDRDGIFVACVAGVGFRYLDLSGKASSWTTAAGFAGPITGAFGLFHTPAVAATADGSDGAAAALISFVEVPPRSWACFRIPAAGASTAGAWPKLKASQEGDTACGAVLKEEPGSVKAELVTRSALPADVAAACGEPGDSAVAVALRSGALRFLDLSTGKAAGKGLKLGQPHTNAAEALARLGPGRVALVREGAEAGTEFFVVAFEPEAGRSVLVLRGAIEALPSLPLGPLLGAAAAAGPAAGPGQEEDRVLLCWDAAGADGAAAAGAGPAEGPLFTSVSLNQEAPALEPLPRAGRPAAALWLCVGSHLAEWAPAAARGGPGKEDALKLSVRDAKFGLHVASADLPLSAASPLLAATAGDVTVLIGGGGRGVSSSLAAVRWSLPRFSLHRLIGRGAAEQPSSSRGTLAPLHEALCGKRPRDDPAVEELFSAKRHVGTDRALAADLRSRRWVPSPGLLDAIVDHRCWAAARALLCLPELDEDFAIRLLGARPELLARVVRRARAPHLLEDALRAHLPAASLPGVLEVLLEWLEAYRDFSEDAIGKAAPGIPSLSEIITFVGALADGCLPSLTRVDPDLLERALDLLGVLQADVGRCERLYAAVRATHRLRRRAGPIGGHAPAVELVELDL